MANTLQSPAYPAKIRKKWYFLTEKLGKPVEEVCTLYAISRKTYYKWRKLDGGDRTYVPRKPHPHTKLKEEVLLFVCEEKLRTNYGPRKMQLLLKRRFGLSVSTTALYKLYQKKRLIRRPQKKLPWYTPLKEPVIPKQPGEVVQMDAKYVWQDGTRKYQRTLVDVYTGFQSALVVETMTSEDTIRAFVFAEKAFPFPILGIQSDNGSENRGDFHQYLGKRGIVHYFIPKSSPQWDGAVERAHGVIDQEYYLNPHRSWESLPEYLHWYNYERIHLGKYLQGLIPEEKFLQYQKKVSPLKVN